MRQALLRRRIGKDQTAPCKELIPDLCKAGRQALPVGLIPGKSGLDLLKKTVILLPLAGHLVSCLVLDIAAGQTLGQAQEI